MTTVTDDFAELEYRKCMENPYYFATKYLMVKDFDGRIIPIQIDMSEEEFNALALKTKSNG